MSIITNIIIISDIIISNTIIRSGSVVAAEAPRDGPLTILILAGCHAASERRPAAQSRRGARRRHPVGSDDLVHRAAHRWQQRLAGPS